MSNLATLQPAPRFTKENAAEHGRRGAEVTNAIRRANKAARITAANLATAQSATTEYEVKRVLRAMQRLPVTGDAYARLAGILDRLWNKAYPTQGTTKAGRQRPAELAAPIEPVEPTPAN